MTPARRRSRCGSKLPEDGWYRWSRVALSPDGRTAYTSMPLSAYDVESGRVLVVAEPDGRQARRSQHHQQLLRAEPGRDPARRHRASRSPAPPGRPDRPGPSRAPGARRRGPGRALLPRREVAGVLVLGPHRAWSGTSPPAAFASGCGSGRGPSPWPSARTTPCCTPPERTGRSASGTCRVRAASSSTAVEPESEPVGTLAPAPGGGHVMAWHHDGLAFYDVAEDRWTGTVGQGRLHEGGDLELRRHPRRERR